MAITGATASNLTPSPVKKAVASNYLDFASGTNGWADQYLPDVLAAEAESYGNRTMAGFLQQVGAEEPMASDQVIWSEQGRLHLAYKGRVSHDDDQASGSANGGQITIESDIDGRAITTTHGVRQNDILLIADSNTTAVVLVTDDPTASTDDNFSVAVYDAGSSTETLATLGFAQNDSDGATDLTILVIGSEYEKGANGRTGQNEPDHKTYSNKPIILKDKYSVSGSDTAQIGWVEVSSEDGTGGYLWFIKSEAETRMRFMDYLEMSMLETVPGSTTAANQSVDDYLGTGAYNGHQGLFNAIENRGNQSSGVTGVNPATDLAEFDAILAEFDKNGAIEENMMFVNRDTALAFDDMLASMNSYGAGGTSYGVFDNSEDMALNLGFAGFRRGSYDFYKSDWKYLNQLDGRGGINATNTVGAIRGVMVPAGVSSVYDQMMGRNMKRPFLHVRFRASETDNRYLKTWVTGSVGAVTSDLDAMEIHYLSERCLVTQGANNFMLLN
tara:strand:- start:3497 stop:4996 length:1500 start_codon:yes stop_codon:yes gene_type:complete